MQVPTIPKGLLEYLQWAYPDKLPEVLPDPGEVEKLIGQQQVIRHLAAKFSLQNRDLLGNK